jgi:hypothetical protein
MRAVALTLIVTLASCSFAARHPATTAAIVGATLGFSTCEIGTDFDGQHAACAGVSAGAALLLGGTVFLAMLLGGEGNTVLQPEEDTRPEPPSIDDVPPPAPAPAPAPAEPVAPPAEPAPAPTP